MMFGAKLRCNECNQYTDRCKCHPLDAAPVPASTSQKFDLTDYSKPLIYSNSADRAPVTVPANTGRESFAMQLGRESLPFDVAARELDVEAERPVFDDPIRLGEDPYKDMQPYFKAIRNAAPGLEYATAVGELIAWMNDRINKAERAARSAAQGTQAESAPVTYRLLDTRDIIEATDEWLAEDAVTWAVNPYRLFDGYAYCEAMLPARRRVAPSPNSPVGGKDKDQ